MLICRRGHGDPRGSCLGTLEPVRHPSTGWRHPYDRVPAPDVNRHRGRIPKIDCHRGSNATRREIALIMYCDRELGVSGNQLESA